MTPSQRLICLRPPSSKSASCGGTEEGRSGCLGSSRTWSVYVRTVNGGFTPSGRRLRGSHPGWEAFEHLCPGPSARTASACAVLHRWSHWRCGLLHGLRCALIATRGSCSCCIRSPKGAGVITSELNFPVARPCGVILMTRHVECVAILDPWRPRAPGQRFCACTLCAVRALSARPWSPVRRSPAGTSWREGFRARADSCHARND